jgi:two-component system phosphate regulon sensor histidine kinase PhoR
MTGRFFTKLLLASILVLLIGTAILDVSLRRIVDGALRQQVNQSLESEARVLGSQLTQNDRALAPQLVAVAARAARSRITVFRRDGSVLATSNPVASPVSLASAPELAAAAAGQTGSRVRAHTLYLAVPAGDLLVRIAYPLTEINAKLRQLRRNILLASLVSLVLATLLAALLANRLANRLRRIVAFAERIAAGDLSARLEERQLDELSAVARALDTTASRLENAFGSLESSRRELATLLDSMQEGVIALTAAGQISWSNSVAARLTHHSIRPGRPFVEAVRDPDVLAAVETALRRRTLARSRGRSIVPGRAFEVNAAPMPGRGAVVVLHDVTEIEQAETVRRDFVANVSHELRTPLTSISGYLETILDSPAPLDETTRDFLSIALRNATRMHRLTEDLLALARVESGDYKLALQPVRASALVADAVDSLTPLVEDAGLALEQGETAGEWVMADPDAIQQVFGNLVENAVKYAASGKRIRVSAAPREQAIEFSVQDFGPGIPYEHQPRIFERFYRVDKARSRESGGTGLGLSIARHIVAAHNGVLRVQSELGQGAAFLFTLPLATTAPLAPPPGESPQPAALEDR